MSLAVIAVAATLPALAMKAKEIDPKPNIAAELDDYSFDIVIDDSITEYHETKTKGIKKLKLESWRTAITDGFEYALEDAQGPTRLTIQVSRAELELVPAAVAANTGIVAVNAQITFKARLQDVAGQTMCTEAATAVAKESTSRVNAMGELVGSAIESMVEIFSAECLEGLGSDLGVVPPPTLDSAIEPDLAPIETSGEATEPVAE